MKRPGLTWGALVASAFLAAACASSRPRRAVPPAPAAPSLAAAPTEAGRAIDGEPDVRDMNLRAIPELLTVRFEYDSDRLDAAALAVLKGNAAWLKAHPEAKAQVAGHCDQRGTVAYNLALGQRRARSVRDYYRALGVDPARVATISWGKEHALCAESSEACWTRNRRAETLEAASAAVAGEPR